MKDKDFNLDSPAGAGWRESLFSGASANRDDPFPIDFEAWERRAESLLSPEAFAHIAGGAGAERTLAANRAAFAGWTLAPRVLTGADERGLETAVLGQPLAAPLFLAPVGVLELAHAEAEAAAARAAARLGLPFILSCQASTSIEDVAAAMDAVRPGARRWFQLYWSRSEGLCESLVQRAEAAGYSAIVLTVDAPLIGWRPRDLARRFAPGRRGMGLAHYWTDPVFAAMLDAPPAEDPDAAIAKFIEIHAHTHLAWPHVERLRGMTDLPLLLKGVLRADDAQRAAECGVDGLIVSNHGGRQLDGARTAADALEEIAAAGSGLELIVDSGVRSGSDMVTALALGAKAVGIGRPYVYALACGGEEGVTALLQSLCAEFDMALALCGVRSPREITRDLLRRA